MQRAGAARIGRGPRDRAVEVPVDLDRRVVPREPAQVVDEPRASDVRRRRAAGTAAARRRRRAPPLARGSLRRGSAPRPRAHRATITLSTGASHSMRPPLARSRFDERVGEPAGAAFGHRPADVLAERAEDPAEEPARSHLRARGRRAAPSRRAAAARLRTRTPPRPSAAPTTTRSARSAADRRDASRREQLAGRRDRRDRREQTVEQAGAHALPALEQTRATRRRRRDATRRATPPSRRGSVESTGHVPSGAGCASTSGARRHRKPYCSRCRLRDDRRRGGQRVERAEHVVDEAGLDQLGRRTAPPSAGAASQHERRPSRGRRAGWRRRGRSAPHRSRPRRASLVMLRASGAGTADLRARVPCTGMARKRDLAEYDAKRDFAATPEPKGAQAADAQADARRASSCRSITPARCTGTCGSNATACSRPGRCRRASPPTRRRTISRCTPRTIRSSTSTFQGEIPQGEYGGGQMRVWDTGTYETEKWSDREVMVDLPRRTRAGQVRAVPDARQPVDDPPHGSARRSRRARAAPTDLATDDGDAREAARRPATVGRGS